MCVEKKKLQFSYLQANWCTNWFLICQLAQLNTQVHLPESRKGITSLEATFFTLPSPLSLTFFRDAGRTFQNSLTNSLPLRRLFWIISLAKYRNETRCSRCADLNDLSHVSTICLAFLRYEMHHRDKADNMLKEIVTKLNQTP